MSSILWIDLLLKADSDRTAMRAKKKTVKEHCKRPGGSGGGLDTKTIMKVWKVVRFCTCNLPSIFIVSTCKQPQIRHNF